MTQQARVKEVVDQIIGLSFMDLVEVTEQLASVLREKGINPFPTAAVAVQSADAASSSQAPKEEEKTKVDVILSGFAADKKLAVIKEVRTITSLGLKEGKDLVESAPNAVISSGLDAAEAADIKAKLEAAGATVELKKK